MNNQRNKRVRRRKRVRAKIEGTSSRPRLSVFRSNHHVWAQLVDDESGTTIVSASDLRIKDKSKKVTDKNKRVLLGEMVGGLIAKKAGEKGIKEAVFDRGGYKYHGIVKAVAEGARKGGLKF